jgi:hypothetical protein
MSKYHAPEQTYTIQPSQIRVVSGYLSVQSGFRMSSVFAIETTSATPAYVA